MVFKNFGQNLDHFGINRRPQDVKTMSSQCPGDVLPTNFWTSRNGHFAAWVGLEDFPWTLAAHRTYMDLLRTSVGPKMVALNSKKCFQKNE